MTAIAPASNSSQLTTQNEEITEAAADVISFWPTNNPAYGISWRYRLGLLNHIGTKSWKGRELRLRTEERDRESGSLGVGG